MNYQEMQDKIDEMAQMIAELQSHNQMYKEMIAKMQSQMDVMYDLLRKHRHTGYDNTQKLS